MEGHYTIGELARSAEVPTSTVRYYERAGLLSPDGRSAGNYRSYSEKSLGRLRFIRAAQAHGFALDDVRMLLRFQDGALSPCAEVQSLIETRLLDLEERLKQLRAVRSVLRASLLVCQKNEPTGRCEVLNELAVGGSTARAKRAPRGRKARNT